MSMVPAFRVDVYRSRGCGCEPGVVSGRYDDLLVLLNDANSGMDAREYVDLASPPENLMVLAPNGENARYGVVLVPYADRDRRTTFGGNFAFAFDAPFRRAISSFVRNPSLVGAIPIHDAVE